MTTLPDLPRETQDLLQAKGDSKPNFLWFRWFRSTDKTVSGFAGDIQNLKDNVESLAENFVFAAYGIETYTGSFPDLDADYQTLDFDTIPVTPRGINFDLVNNTISVDYPGAYSFDLSGALIHKKDNVLESTNIRAYDVTTGVAGVPFPISLAAQSTVTNLSRSFLVDLEPGDEYRLEIGGGDVVTNVSFSGLLARIFNVGEWRGGALP